MLFTWINKSFHRVAVDFAVDVEHNHLPKAFWGLLHCNGHVFFHIVLSGICTNPRVRHLLLKQESKNVACVPWSDCFFSKHSYLLPTYLKITNMSQLKKVPDVLLNLCLSIQIKRISSEESDSLLLSFGSILLLLQQHFGETLWGTRKSRQQDQLICW